MGGWGWRYREGEATHFSRSPHGLLHFSFDHDGLNRLLKYIEKQYLMGIPAYFNEIVGAEKYRFFIECVMDFGFMFDVCSIPSRSHMQPSKP